jgi:hypothetical protein
LDWTGNSKLFGSLKFTSPPKIVFLGGWAAEAGACQLVIGVLWSAIVARGKTKVKFFFLSILGKRKKANFWRDFSRIFWLTDPPALRAIPPAVLWDFTSSRLSRGERYKSIA